MGQLSWISDLHLSTGRNRRRGKLVHLGPDFPYRAPASLPSGLPWNYKIVFPTKPQTASFDNLGLAGAGSPSSRPCSPPPKDFYTAARLAISTSAVLTRLGGSWASTGTAESRATSIINSPLHNCHSSRRNPSSRRKRRSKRGSIPPGRCQP